MAPITPKEQEILASGFIGPRPGSNFFPLLCIKRDGIEITGERIEELYRAGMLVSAPRVDGKIPEIKGGDAGPYGEIPDIELTHNYELAAAFRTATNTGGGK